ncbi:hypothetical protein QYE76_018862 [Lolium multiflorum]|uniref:Ankyrin repeat domain-containing protein n=1 Tax=Lolium multiflorum TaxID=4521 RepID=A0AAD8VER1_LOLMU|nr:hypothetical protein QYE76_018862 [Lolium multiflorum]
MQDKQVPADAGGDTALHLAVRLRLPSLASALAAAGADPTLQNHAGWTPLQEALCLGCKDIAAVLLRAHRLAAWAKLRRRAPALSAALRRVQDFYLEVDFHFESSVVPLLSRAAPSDTYRIWKRGANLRADTTLAGFDGLRIRRIRRADHSFLFFGDETDAGGRLLPPGSLLVLHRGKREVHDAFAAAAAAGDEDAATSDAAAYRPGLNITSARLVPRTTWLRKEKMENAASAGRKDFTFELAVDEDDEFLPLEIRDDDEDGDFLVADIPPPPSRRSCYVPGQRSVTGPPSHMGTPRRRRNSVDVPRRLPTCASVGRVSGCACWWRGGIGRLVFVLAAWRKGYEMTVLRAARPTPAACLGKVWRRRPVWPEHGGDWIAVREGVRRSGRVGNIAVRVAGQEGIAGLGQKARFELAGYPRRHETLFSRRGLAGLRKPAATLIRSCTGASLFVKI